jgi:Acyl-CoA dehydrogenase, N-terminal domain
LFARLEPTSSASAMGVSLSPRSATLQLGERHPIAREPAGLIVGRRPIQYQYLERFEGILYGPEHITLWLMEPLIAQHLARAGTAAPTTATAGAQRPTDGAMSRRAQHRGPAMTALTQPRSLSERFPRFIDDGGAPDVRELEWLRARAKRFADEHVRPRAIEIDRRTDEDPSWFDWDLVRAGAEHGMLGFPIPKPAGGGGGLATQAAVVMEELCAACTRIALIFGAHALGISPLLRGPLAVGWRARRARALRTHH